MIYAKNRNREPYQEIARRIKAERRTQRISQADMAQYLGLSRTSIVNIEAGRQHLTIDMLYRIADALDVSVFSLLPPSKVSEEEMA